MSKPKPRFHDSLKKEHIIRSNGYEAYLVGYDGRPPLVMIERNGWSVCIQQSEARRLATVLERAASLRDVLRGTPQKSMKDRIKDKILDIYEWLRDRF